MEFFYDFLSKSDQTLYKNRIEKRRLVSVEGVNSIKQSLQSLKKERLTKLGRKRMK